MKTHPDDEIKPASAEVLQKYGKKAKNEKKAMAKLGNVNANKYSPTFPEIAFKLCLLFGATDERLAEFFEVSRNTFGKWKSRYPAFREALKEGKAIADANVAQSLYMSAIGYERDEIELKVVSLGEGMGSKVEEVPVKRYYPPSVPAAKYWLGIRQPEIWREDVTIQQQNVLNVIKIGYGEQTDSA